MPDLFRHDSRLKPNVGGPPAAEPNVAFLQRVEQTIKKAGDSAPQQWQFPQAVV